MEKSKHSGALFLVLYSVWKTGPYGKKELGQRIPAHVRLPFCPSPASYECQTMLGVISNKYIFSQTLWEVVCKGNVNRNDLQIPILLHKHRRNPRPKLWPFTSPTEPRQNISAGSFYTRCSLPRPRTDLCQTSALATHDTTQAELWFTVWPMNYYPLIFT